MVFVNGELFGDSIEAKKIYYFKSEQLKDTIEPHYFIVIAIPTDELIIFTCCTKQFEKRARYIELNNLPYSTLVRIKPDNENKLPLESYVDCNSCFKHSKTELIKMYEANKITFTGYIIDSKFEEICQGIIDSPLIAEEIKELF